jgi:outer membrane protein assembly factor BamB
VIRGRTTRCCSVLLFLLASTAVVRARTDPTAPLALLPASPAWDLDLNNDLITPPVFLGERGYFPIAGDRVAAYDVRHGTLLWIAPVAARYQPTVGEGLVFIADRGQVTALHDDTGAVAWRTPLVDEISAPPLWAGGWLIITTSSGGVLAFRASDGGAIWTKTLDRAIRPSTAVESDRVYLALDDGRIVALQLETGEMLWERRLGGPATEMLALDERIFAGSTDNYFYALRARDGEVLWRWSTGADVVGRPVTDRRHVYFVSLDNVLRALDRNNGAQRWKQGLPIRPTRGPVVAGDVLLVSGITQNVPAYLAKDGAPAGSLTAGGELATAPHVLMGPSLPVVVVVARDLARGTLVRNLMRSVEPGEAAIAPLPNPIIPTGPTPPYEVRLVPLPGLVMPDQPEGPYEWPIRPLPGLANPETPGEPLGW